MMTILRFFLLILLFLIGLNKSIAQNTQVVAYVGEDIDLLNYKIATLFKGQQDKFVAKQLDVRGIAEIASLESNQWLIEVPFTLSHNTLKGSDIWLQYRGNTNASMIHINGHSVVRNGGVGSSKETEVLGKSVIRQSISNEYLLEGRNVIHIRFSNFHDMKGTIVRDLVLANYRSLEEQKNIMSLAPIILSGVFVFSIFANLALYFSLNRQKVFLALSGLFLFSFMLTAHEAAYWYGSLHTVSFWDNYQVRRAIEAFINFSLMMVVFYELAGKKNTHFVFLILFMLLWLTISIAGSSGTLMSSFLVLGYCVFVFFETKSKNLIFVAAISLLVILNLIDEFNLIEDFEFVGQNTLITSFVFKLDNLGITLFALIMFFASAKRIWQKNQELNNNILKVAKLEHQFVQKHIQPHFVINSLMSLQQLIHKEPEQAGSMIEALSEEFYLLTKASDKSLVSIKEEIDMCKTHLTIMSIQQRAHFELIVEGITGTEKVPPALFHTLIENGITHGFVGNESGNFSLKKKLVSDGVVYELFNDGSPISSKSKNESNGSGLNYVKAQLEAWHKGKWSLNSGPLEDGWLTSIKLKS